MTEYISSDTNVWIDFWLIDKPELPFRLSCIYIMFNESIESEIIYPEGLKDKLRELGLRAVEITTEEFVLADNYSNKYHQLTVHDAIAMAIAKNRGIMLLTGDKPLRNAAAKEDVTTIGTIGILDRLYEERLINKQEYTQCLEELLSHLDNGIRLPREEIEKRLNIMKGGDATK